MHIRRPHLTALALVLALALLPSCGSGGSDDDATEEVRREIPSAAAGSPILYTTAGDSLFVDPMDGGPARLVQAEARLQPTTFAALTASDEIVYEAYAEDGARELWVAPVGGKGEHRRLLKGIREVLAVHGGEVVCAGKDQAGERGLIAVTVADGETRMLLPGEVEGGISRDTTGTAAFVLATDGGHELRTLAAGAGESELVDTVPSGKALVSAAATPAGVLYVVAAPGAGEYGTLMRRSGDGEPVEVAKDSRMLAAAPDGGALVERVLRGGVSGVRRAQVVYVPVAEGEGEVTLGTYVSVLYAAEFVGSDRVLVSSRTEGVNRFELIDLAEQASVVLSEDPSLQVMEIRTFGSAGALCVRSRLGGTQTTPDGGAQAPTQTRLEDELVWMPFSASEEPLTLTSTTAGFLHIAEVASP